MMQFETLQMISLNGSPGQPNDDRCRSSARLAWVVDGATDMGPPGLLGAQGGAAWLAATASAGFAMAATHRIEDTCGDVFAYVAAQFQAQKTRDVAAAWEVPQAAFGAVQLTARGLSVAWAADSPILQMSGADVQWSADAPDTSAEAADALALGVGVGATDGFDGAVLEDRRAHRARAGHVALSTDAAASAAVTRYAHHPVRAGDEILLMSDGFASLVTDYARYTAVTFAAALHAKGLAEMLREIREIETEDAACLRYPRFKVSDDPALR